VDIPTLLCQYRAMLGEIQNQFSLTRAALNAGWRSRKQFLISQLLKCRLNKRKAQHGLRQSVICWRREEMRPLRRTAATRQQ
jgi:hypothetical protein